MNRRPLTVIACCWIAGSGMAAGYEGSRFWLLWLGASLMCPAAGLIGRLPWRKLAMWWLAFSLGAAYWLYSEANNVSRIEQAWSATDAGSQAAIDSASGTGNAEGREPIADGTAVHLEGTIVSAVEIDGDRADFTLKVSRITVRILTQAAIGEAEREQAGTAAGEAPGKTSPGPGMPKGEAIPGGERVAVQLRLAAQDELRTAAGWRRGQHVALDGTLEAPQSARNFGGFDYRRYLHNQRIHWLAKATGASSMRVQSGTWGAAAFLGQIDALRADLGGRIERLFPDWQAGYMKGLLIGLQDELDPDKYADFSQLGLTHILAISGSHVAINVGLLFWLLRLCRVSRETALTVVLIFVPAYMLVTGFSPSVIRSGMMTMLGIYLLKRGLLKDSLNVLSAAALLMLLWEPYYLLNVSFQLSFAVTAGLIVFVPLLTPYLLWLPPKVRGTAAITLAAQIVSFPLTVTYFNQFSLLSVAANLLLVPVIGAVALPLGTAALLLSLASVTLGAWAAIPVRLLNEATFWATDWLSGRSGFMTYWKSPSPLWIAAFYAGGYLLLYWGKRYGGPGSPDAGSTWSDDETVPLAQVRRTGSGRGGASLFRWKEALKLFVRLGSVLRSGFRSRMRRTGKTAQWDIDSVSFSKEDSVRIGVAAVLSWAGRRRRDLLRTAIAGGMVLLLVSGYQPAYAKGTGYIEFIDVGQGDCALITTPSGAHVLVDGGGTVSFRKAADAWRERREPFEVGAKTVVPLLKKRGIHRLDAVILTHGDQDHLGGLQAVLEQFPVEALLINGSLAESATMRTLMETALSKRIPLYSASRGMALKPDGETRLEFLYPLQAEEQQGRIPYEKEQNHRSIVFLLRMNGASFLFTGDMDEAAEREVLELEQGLEQRRGTPPGGKETKRAVQEGNGGETEEDDGHPTVDVMKVAHHGSKTSTSAAWLAFWRPASALISVGASNSYGHPHPTVTERLAERGIRIFRTDRQGEVQMKVSDGQIRVRRKSG
ncbi:ComEC/Rec2 family competence protein [Paenibacillus macerans]|uniref:ComEC/Rec2 family competence protein n=1 Tax=Paenibacillus macerans TaxID=44252 RepID=UPI003D323A7C